MYEFSVCVNLLLTKIGGGSWIRTKNSCFSRHALYHCHVTSDSMQFPAKFVRSLFVAANPPCLQLHLKSIRYSNRRERLAFATPLSAPRQLRMAIHQTSRHQVAGVDSIGFFAPRNLQLSKFGAGPRI